MLSKLVDFISFSKKKKVFPFKWKYAFAKQQSLISSKINEILCSRAIAITDFYRHLRAFTVYLYTLY